MSNKENLHQTLSLQQEMAVKLIDMFSIQCPQVFRIHLESMFMAWNLSEEANEPDFRESYQLTYKMLMDFMMVFASREVEDLADLKQMRNSKAYSNEAIS